RGALHAVASRTGATLAGSCLAGAMGPYPATGTGIRLPRATCCPHPRGSAFGQGTQLGTVEALSPGKSQQPEEDRMATIVEREAEQIERANTSGLTPVVFIHGLWLLPSSWDRWAVRFEDAGYTALTPAWPDDPETVE